MSRSRIPLADAAELRRQLLRTRLVRLGLAAAIVAVAVLALVRAFDLSAKGSSVVPASDGGIVVLDVSTSITASAYRQIDATLETLTGSGRRVGLILFSDGAYEALPPGTRASELGGFRRFFRPVRPGEDPDRTGRLRAAGVVFPASPWSRGFSGGTRISAGLELARRVIDRDRIEDPSVVLVSDLSTDERDVAPLGAVLAGFTRDRVPLRVVALAPSRSDRLFFRELLRGRGEVVGASNAVRARGGAPFPTGLVAAAVVLFALLTANEIWCGRLRFARRPA